MLEYPFRCSSPSTLSFAFLDAAQQRSAAVPESTEATCTATLDVEVTFPHYSTSPLFSFSLALSIWHPLYVFYGASSLVCCLLREYGFGPILYVCRGACSRILPFFLCWLISNSKTEEAPGVGIPRIHAHFNHSKLILFQRHGVHGGWSHVIA